MELQETIDDAIVAETRGPKPGSRDNARPQPMSAQLGKCLVATGAVLGPRFTVRPARRFEVEEKQQLGFAKSLATGLP